MPMHAHISAASIATAGFGWRWMRSTTTAAMMHNAPAIIDDPAKQLVQLCDDLVQRASAAGYRGCPLVNVTSEITDGARP